MKELTSIIKLCALMFLSGEKIPLCIVFASMILPIIIFRELFRFITIYTSYKILRKMIGIKIAIILDKTKFINEVSKIPLSKYTISEIISV